jgi:hypothetical protein
MDVKICQGERRGNHVYMNCHDRATKISEKILSLNRFASGNRLVPQVFYVPAFSVCKPKPQLQQTEKI